MEIIQTYMSDDTEICAISDGTTIHLVDKNDLSIENVAVGTKLRSSQMNEVYLEIPISELREMSRRSEIFVDPDEGEEDEPSDEEASDEGEEPAPPDWRVIAADRFLDEFSYLSNGLEVRVLAPVDMKISWEDSSNDECMYNPSDEDLETISDLADLQETFRSQVRDFNRRIEVLRTEIEFFVSGPEEYYDDDGDPIDEEDVFHALYIAKTNRMASREAAE